MGTIPRSSRASKGALIAREWAEWQQACVDARCRLCGVVHETACNPAECERWAHARLADLLGQHARDTGHARGQTHAIQRGWRCGEINRLRGILATLRAA